MEPAELAAFVAGRPLVESLEGVMVADHLGTGALEVELDHHGAEQDRRMRMFELLAPRMRELGRPSWEELHDALDDAEHEAAQRMIDEWRASTD